MSFVIGLLIGAALGYGGAYLQHNPERWAELKALFAKKDAP
jgi:hypothetical protein